MKYILNINENYIFLHFKILEKATVYKVKNNTNF